MRPEDLEAFRNTMLIERIVFITAGVKQPYEPPLIEETYVADLNFISAVFFHGVWTPQRMAVSKVYQLAGVDVPRSEGVSRRKVHEDDGGIKQSESA